MKHDQRRKAAAVLGLILCLILLTAGFAAKIGSQQKQIPENPVTGVIRKDPRFSTEVKGIILLWSAAMRIQ